MSFDTIGNSENPIFEKTKNLLDIDVSGIEQDYVKVHEIQDIELVDSEDNKVTIPSDLQDFFPDEFNENEKGIEGKVAYVKNKFYNSLGIDKNLDNIKDNKVKLFKGLVDGWTLTLEEIESLYDNGIDDIVENLKKLNTPEKIWDFIVSLGEDVVESLKGIGEPYQTGMIIGGLGTGPFKFSKFFTKLDKIDGKNESKQEVNEIDIEMQSLYDNPDYNFLKDYKNVLKEKLNINDIVGEGNNALILRHPDKVDKVLKIAKPGRTDKLDIEFDNHMLFRKGLKDLKKEFKGTAEGDILKEFNIPEIKSFGNIDGIYEMEKINGLSVKSIIHLDYYKNDLYNLPKDLYKGNFNDNLIKFFEENGLSKKEIGRLKENGITDNDIKIFLENKGFKTYPEGKKYNKEQNKDYVKKLQSERYNNDFRKNEIIPFKEVLEKNGYYHNDIHWGNIMIDENGKKYLIDFGNSEVK